MNRIPILIIDDDEDDRYVLGRHINETGLDVTIFEKDNGKTALEFLEAYEENKKINPDFPPILVFLDINMPLIDGFEFLQRFSKIKEPIYSKTCVVMMFTSSQRKEDRDRIAPFPFVTDYLVKGQFTTAELRDKIVSQIKELKTN